ncbi:unnamed protein product [Merluccius merluccius]
MVYEELEKRLNDSGYRNWIKAGHCLLLLKEGLSPYADREVRCFHGDLLNQNAALRGCCQRACSFRGRKPSSLCQLCLDWSKVILRHYRSSGVHQVNWENCSPARWREDHWELAKAYMPRGLSMVRASDQCDASALLNLLNFCDWFHSVDPSVVRAVIRCRNEVMHSCKMNMDDVWMAHYHATLKQLLGQVTSMARTQQQIEEVFTVDLSINVTGLDQMDAAVDGLQVDSNNLLHSAASISQLEAELLGERLRVLVQDTETQSEELQKVRGFLDRNHDLQEKLRPQWQRLEAVQAQQGQQIDKLTNRVGELEKHTEVTTEFSTEPIMYKNRLLERAARYKWHEPVFSELDESTGFRGQVEVNGKKILGSQVCKSKQQAHQEVSKKALQELGSVMAIEEAALCQDQSQTVSQAGPYFFAAVTVSLAVDVSPDKGGSAPVDREEYAYQKLVSLFGLEPSSLSNKEEVLQYCRELNVPPPVERSSSDCFVLRLNGQITFYDLEGSKRKGQAEQQAARAALKALCGVLDTAEVFRENHKGALAELLVRFKQAGKPDYRVTERLGGRGERVTWLPGEDPTASQVVGPPDSGHGNKEGEDDDEAALAAIESPMKRMWTLCSDIPSKMTKVLPSTDDNDLPSKQEEFKSEGPSRGLIHLTAILVPSYIIVSDGRFLGSVQLTIQVDLPPCQATDQEGAVEAAYSDLTKALSLSPASASSAERQAVLEFLELTQCPPLVEKIETATSGTYQCALKIDGQFTFHSPERTSTKKEAERLAARQALKHLEGLLSVDHGLLPGGDNYKGRLQELMARLGSMVVPVYSTIDGNDPHNAHLVEEVIHGGASSHV